MSRTGRASLPPPVEVGGAHVLWHRADTTDPLAAHLTALLGSPGTTGRLCPHCGSSAHGRPWARHPRATHLFVSVARAGGYAVTAVGREAHLGVDVEVVADVHRGWSADVVLAPGETDDGTARTRALTWAAKEATLKRGGVGLHTPMSQVRLAQVSGLHELPAPAGLVAVLAGSG